MSSVTSNEPRAMRENLANMTMLCRFALYAYEHDDMAEVKRLLRTIRYAAAHLSAAIFIADETRDLPKGIRLTHG